MVLNSFSNFCFRKADNAAILLEKNLEQSNVFYFS